MAQTFRKNKFIKLTNEITEKFCGEFQEGIDVTKTCEGSMATLHGFSTVDLYTIEQIRNLINTIMIYTQDKTLKRPLNIILNAEPGCGKSFLIKCLSEKFQKINMNAVSVNMANLNDFSEIKYTLEKLRNIVAAGMFPLLFIDEIDAKTEQLYQFLSLLWDGEINIGHQFLKIGRIIIIMAASTEIFKDFVLKSPSERETFLKKTNIPKFQDFISRINGVITDIPNLHKRNHDKIPIAISLLQRRFEGCTQIPFFFLKFRFFEKICG